MQGSNEYFFNFFLKFPNIYCFMGFLNVEFIDIRLNIQNIDLDTQIDYHKTMLLSKAVILKEKYYFVIPHLIRNPK